MREELDKLLCEKYPLLFKDRNADMRTTAMCWGFAMNSHILRPMLTLSTDLGVSKAGGELLSSVFHFLFYVHQFFRL